SSPVLLLLFCSCYTDPRVLHSFPTRRSSDLSRQARGVLRFLLLPLAQRAAVVVPGAASGVAGPRVMEDVAGLEVLLVAGLLEDRSEEHTSELQSRRDLVCRLLLEKKNNQHQN